MIRFRTWNGNPPQPLGNDKRPCSREEFWLLAKSPRRESSAWKVNSGVPSGSPPNRKLPPKRRNVRVGDHPTGTQRTDDTELGERIGLNSTADSETVSVQGQGAIEEALLCREGVRALPVSSPHYLAST